LLTRIQSDYVYGTIEDPEYLLYSVHPALRIYLKKISNHNEFKYGKKYTNFYYNLAWDTYNAISKEDLHLQSLARFNIIFQGETNDFDRAIEIAEDKWLKAETLRALSQILIKLGILSEALEYGKTSLGIHSQINDRVGVAADYGNIGLVLGDMGKNEEALESHNKSLEINKKLNDRVELAKNYYNISFVLVKIDKHEATKALYNAHRILQEFEKENNYRHPFMEKVNSRISYLKGIKS
jgi:tetratricopeptide (TPR) repeat protein